MTLINALFGAILLGGAGFRPQLPQAGDGRGDAADRKPAWRTLTIRWGVFFFALALLNEIVWRSVTTDTWVNFKVFGLLPLTLVFALANAPFMAKHMIADGPKPPE